jgi:hypothetical protein
VQRGKHRGVAAVAGSLILAGALAGCSSADVTLATTNGGAVAIGQQAIGFGTSSSTSSGWRSPISCPQSFFDGFRASLPATDSYAAEDPSTFSGLSTDPQLTQGYLATCVIRLTTPQATLTEVVFFDIDQTHEDALSKKLLDDGFVSQGNQQATEPDGQSITETIYSNGTARILTGTMTVDSTPAFLIAG